MFEFVARPGGGKVFASVPSLVAVSLGRVPSGMVH